MKKDTFLSFEEEDFPIIVHPRRTSDIDTLEAARRALHEAIEIKCFYEGTSTLLIGTETLTAKAGDVIVISPYEFHATVDYGAEKGKYHLIMVEPEFFSDMGSAAPDLRNLLLAKRISFRTRFEGNTRMHSILTEVAKEMEERKPSYRLAVRGLMLEFLALLLREGIREEPSSTSSAAARHYASIEPALRCIRDEYPLRHTVEELASLCSISKYHFCRIFKLVTGMTAMQYLTDYRLKIADTMLSNTGESIAQVCRSVGFEDESYFCRLYKKRFGISPGKREKRSKT